MALLALGAAVPALAQENLEAGKTAAQLYASDCAICHKSPRGLARGVGILGLDNFLREHYTSSHESANAITAYLQAIDREPAPSTARGRRAAKSGHKSDKKAKRVLPPNKPSATKSSAGAPSATKSSATKSSATKSSATKSSETKSGESKKSTPAHEVKSSDTKQGERKTENKPEHKPTGDKAETSKSGADKPAKDDKPEKSN